MGRIHVILVLFSNKNSMQEKDTYEDLREHMRVLMRSHNLLDMKQSNHKTQTLWRPGLMRFHLPGATNPFSKT